MSTIGVNVPYTYVYVEISDPAGAPVIHRLVYPHDGVHQAVAEALAAFEQLKPGWRIRDVWTHQDEPRRFRPEPVVKRSLEAREY